MNFLDYQEKAMALAVYPNMGDNMPYTVLGLTEEAGEVAGKLKKCLRDHGGVFDEARRTAILKEMGDVLWYLAAVSYEMGTTLEWVAELNLEKLYGRKERGTLHGAGDER